MIQIDAVFYDYQYCEGISNISVVTRYPHNLMPIFIGLVMLKFVHFMSVTAEKIEQEDEEIEEGHDKLSKVHSSRSPLYKLDGKTNVSSKFSMKGSEMPADQEFAISSSNVPSDIATNLRALLNHQVLK